jgi:hypothetical protein
MAVAAAESYLHDRPLQSAGQPVGAISSNDLVPFKTKGGNSNTQ